MLQADFNRARDFVHEVYTDRLRTLDGFKEDPTSNVFDRDGTAIPRETTIVHACRNLTQNACTRTTLLIGKISSASLEAYDLFRNYISGICRTFAMEMGNFEIVQESLDKETVKRLNEEDTLTPEDSQLQYEYPNLKTHNMVTQRIKSFNPFSEEECAPVGSCLHRDFPPLSEDQLAIWQNAADQAAEPTENMYRVRLS